MALISLRNLGVTLGAPLFSNLNFTLQPADRVGIVAANGRGKSTLLNAIAGRIEPTVGDIVRSRGLTLGYVEQSVPAGLLAVPFHEAVRQALPVDQADNESWRVDITLDSLDVPQDIRGMPVGQLSGGWQRLVLLARVAVMEPGALHPLGNRRRGIAQRPGQITCHGAQRYLSLVTGRLTARSLLVSDSFMCPLFRASILHRAEFGHYAFNSLAGLPN